MSSSTNSPRVTAGAPVAPPPEAPRSMPWARWFALSTTFQEERFFLLLAVFIGLFSGLAVVCFRLAIDWSRIWLLGQIRDPVVNPFLRREPEAVAAHRRAGLNDHPMAETHPVVDRHVRVEDAIVADLRSHADEHARIDHATPADAGVRADGDEVVNVRAVAHHRRRFDGCARADAGKFLRPVTVEQDGDLREGVIWIGDDDLRGRALDRFGDHHRPRLRVGQERRVARVGQKRNLSGLRLGQAGHGGNPEGGIADHAAADVSGQCFECLFVHIESGRGSMSPRRNIFKRHSVRALVRRATQFL